MEAILSRVGVSDVELRQHCVAAVNSELQQADKNVQDAVAALKQTLKVVQASRELHKSLVLNASDDIQAAFRQLGDSCNQLGPLLRLLHHQMGANRSTTATTVPATTATSTTTASPCAKRKATTVDLTGPPPPARKQKTAVEAEPFRTQLSKNLQEIRGISKKQYSVTTHNQLANFVKRIYATEKFNNWQPQQDPELAQLLNEMEKRMDVFKESAVQSVRKDTMEQWQKEMKFTPSLNLTSSPPKNEWRVSSRNAVVCKTGKDFNKFVKHADTIVRTLDGENTEIAQKRKYFQPLLDAAISFYAAVATAKRGTVPGNPVHQGNHYLRILSGLAVGADLTRNECEKLEEMLYFIRLAAHKSGKLGKKKRKNTIA
ncbi:hypothetical protein PHMEG_0002768 [Phytophthora megakarya]|uniref:Uncharacterized protein n=1 Tax=Phytophthora megakarya TaxID=4795 RepID=A0A225WY62_9STRA|nr:hypothetical protein PHMEG_0002768 [Phytophthora megakarya]